MSAPQTPSNQQAADAANGVPTDYEAWRQGRWEEIAGANGKANVVAAVDGTVEVPSGGSFQFPHHRVGFAGGADGSYGLVVMDQGRVERTGLSGIDTFPYDPAWVFEGQYRAAPEGRRIEVPRLTIPPSTEAIPAPVDLVVTIDGTEYVLAVLQEFPGHRLVIFTDETNGDQTPEIGRWLVLPLLGPGRRTSRGWKGRSTPSSRCATTSPASRNTQTSSPPAKDS